MAVPQLMGVFAHLLLLSQLLSPGGARFAEGGQAAVNIIPEDKGKFCSVLCAEINGDDTFSEGDCYCIVGHEPVGWETDAVSRVIAESERAGMPMSVTVVGPDQGNRNERCLIGMSTALRARAKAAKRAFLAPPQRPGRKKPGKEDVKDSDEDDKSCEFMSQLASLAGGVVRAALSNNNNNEDSDNDKKKDDDDDDSGRSAAMQGQQFQFLTPREALRDPADFGGAWIGTASPYLQPQVQFQLPQAHFQLQPQPQAQFQLQPQTQLFQPQVQFQLQPEVQFEPQAQFQSQIQFQPQAQLQPEVQFQPQAQFQPQPSLQLTLSALPFPPAYPDLLLDGAPTPARGLGTSSPALAEPAAPNPPQPVPFQSSLSSQRELNGDSPPAAQQLPAVTTPAEAAEASATKALIERVRARRRRKEKKLRQEEAAGDPIVGAPPPSSSTTTTPRPPPRTPPQVGSSARNSGHGVVVSPVRTGSVYLTPDGASYSSMAGSSSGSSPNRPSVIMSTGRTPVGSPTSVIVSPTRGVTAALGTPPTSPLSVRSSSSSSLSAPSSSHYSSSVEEHETSSLTSSSSGSRSPSPPSPVPLPASPRTPETSPPSQHTGSGGSRASVIVGPSPSPQRAGVRRRLGSGDSDSPTGKDPKVGAPNPLEWAGFAQFRDAFLDPASEATRSSETLSYLLGSPSTAPQGRTAPAPVYTEFRSYQEPWAIPMPSLNANVALDHAPWPFMGAAMPAIPEGPLARDTRESSDSDFLRSAGYEPAPPSAGSPLSHLGELVQSAGHGIQNAAHAAAGTLQNAAHFAAGTIQNATHYVAHIGEPVVVDRPVVSPYIDPPHAAPKARGAVQSVVDSAGKDVLQFAMNRGVGAAQDVQGALTGTLSSAAHQGAKTVEELQAATSESIQRVKAAQDAVRAALQSATELAGQGAQVAQDAQALAVGTLQTAGSKGSVALQEAKGTVQHALQSAATQAVHTAEATAKEGITKATDVGVQSAQSAISQLAAAAQGAVARAREAVARAAPQDPTPAMFYNAGQGYTWTTGPSQDVAVNAQPASSGFTLAQTAVDSSGMGRAQRMFAKAGLGLAGSMWGRRADFRASPSSGVVFKVEHSPPLQPQAEPA